MEDDIELVIEDDNELVIEDDIELVMEDVIDGIIVGKYEYVNVYDVKVEDDTDIENVVLLRYILLFV